MSNYESFRLFCHFHLSFKWKTLDMSLKIKYPDNWTTNQGLNISIIKWCSASFESSDWLLKIFQPIRAHKTSLS